MSDPGKEYRDFFTKTFALYKWVASYLLMLEKLDADYVCVGAINEIRDIVSHLYSYIDDTQSHPDAIAANYIKAKDHLDRAYVDLFSALCIVLIERITNFELKYSTRVISEEYPNYYTQIRPKIYELYDDENKIRLNRNLDKLTAMEENHKTVMELRGFYNSLTKTIPSFEAKKKKVRLKNFWKLVLAIGMPILAALFAYYLSTLNKK